MQIEEAVVNDVGIGPTGGTMVEVNLSITNIKVGIEVGKQDSKNSIVSWSWSEWQKIKWQ